MCLVAGDSCNFTVRVAFVAVPPLLVIAIGGVLGSLARYGVVLLVGDNGPGSWPWATLAVNLVGALLIGVIATSLTVREGPHWARLFLVTGVLGGFTTFSAFALETGELLDAGRVTMAAGYVGLTMAAGLLAVRLGAMIARAR